MMLEALEQRRLLSLLGVMPNVPAIAYAGGGGLTYTASTKDFAADSTPVAIIFPDGTVDPVSDPTDLSLNISVNNDGTLAGSGTAAMDLTVTGSIDDPSELVYTGTLITGTVTQFGYQDNGDGTATYDFRFTATGGELLTNGMFAGQDVGLVLNSENSTFQDVNPGDPGFSVDFSGDTKGVLGAIPELDSIAGVAYNDQNDNGALDNGEPGINGVSITLSGTDDNGNPVLETTTTQTINGIAGSYDFTLLNPGTYTVTENATPPGYFDGQDSAGTDGGTVGPVGTNAISNINLDVNQTGGDNATGYDFASILPSNIGGNVFNDVNANNVDNAEPGIAGVNLTLSGTNDLGQSISLTTVSSPSGTYDFTGLRPGTYSVKAAPPAGYISDSSAGAGSLGGSASVNAVNNIAVTPGESGANYNFGYYQPVSISGNVYDDTNDNGVDNAEPGVAGVTITLTGTNGMGNPVSLSTTTASNGTYSFSGLTPGNYTVTETPPAGYLPGSTNPGSLGGTASGASVTSITANAGQSGTNYNFGEVLPSTLNGFVYNDANDNGVDNAGEAGIAGVTVTLTGTNDLGNSVSVTTTTASNGSYSFAGLRPGTYTLTETPPVGYLNGTDSAGSLGGTVGTDAISAIVIPAAGGATGSPYNFGELLPSSISGIAYLDSNGNDVDNSEPGISGLTVTLTGTNDLGQAVSATTTTASNGTYSFTGLRPGTYAVAETAPAGYVTEPGDVGSVGGTAGTESVSSVTLAQNQAATSYNFGQYQTSSISGTVYNDLNANDTDNSEPGIAGVTVTLTGTNGLGNAVSATTTTASNGTYSFAGLAPGNYTVTETPPAGFTTEAANAGSLGGTAATAVVSNVTVTSGESGVNYNFGQYQADSISGTVYNDLNGNDVDNSEPGIAGVTVTLTGTNGLGNPVTLTTTSASNGTYSFVGLAPGTYTVTETPPAGYVTETANAGSGGGTAGTAVVSNVTLTSGEAATSYNFGQYQTAALAGTVYVDNNSNDTFDAGDTGLAGVTVKLTGTNGAGNAVSLTTTTASNGGYSFTGLAPGNYTITETQPAGYTGETANSGSLGGTAAVGAISSIMVVSANSGVNYNFGEIVPLTDSVTGTVYTDLTGNGLTSDDTALAGVTIYLYKDVNGNGTLDASDGSPIATTVSAANGTYSFTNLTPGKYIVAEVTPNGYIETAPSLPDYYGFSIAAGQKITSLNFDNYQESNCMPTNVSFKLSGGGCTTTTVTDLRGATAQSETVTVTFTVPTGAPMTYTLVSYNAPDSFFNASDASQQTEYQVATGTFSSGTHTLTVTIPANYYQIDFVCGAAINQLGPAGSNIFYSAQNRLISADNAGLHDDVDDESATMLFWSSLGQTLIKDFGGSTSTALGNWLATTYPNLFGGSILGNKTAETVAAKYMTYYNVSGQKNNAQVMATALNIYASTLSLGGGASTSFGFVPTTDGLGDATFDVGTNGAAFGVANNSTISVTQMMVAVNANANNGVLYNNVTSLLNDCYNQLGQVNGDGGIN
jgi:sarcosine oxidase gamma subunit